MKDMTKKILCLLLSASMVFSNFGTSFSAYATNQKSEGEVQDVAPIVNNDVEDVVVADEITAEADVVQSEPVVTAEDSDSTRVFTIDDVEYELPVIDNPAGVVDTAQVEDTEVDMNDPVIVEVEEELSDMKVLNADGESVGLTEEQIGQALYLYQQYLDQWTANADIMGVQFPYYLGKNDNGEDGLGIMGEMLTLAGHTVNDVREGKYSFDDLMGMIMNFMYGDMFAIQYFRTDVENKREEALKFVKDSGAKTEYQMSEVLNSWLAQHDTFDMGYIMGAGTDSPMNVEEEVKNEHWNEMYAFIYDQYEGTITASLHDPIYAGIKAAFVQQFYEGAIKAVIHDNVYEMTLNSEDIQGAIAAGYMTKEEAEATAEEEATKYADNFMQENDEAIKADPEAFIYNLVLGSMQEAIEAGQMTLEEAQAQADAAVADVNAQRDLFIANAETNGIEVDPVNAPGYLMTIEMLTQQQMDQPLDDLGGMTPNEAIPLYTAQAATGLTDGIVSYWEGCHIGVFAYEKSVCLGYSRAFGYLWQCLHPEIYIKEGGSYKNAEDWKTAKELYYDENGELDPNQGYTVDLVRIWFDSDVSMYGVVQGDFDSDHFWNAVKLDGQWYYLDACYTDVYTEVMAQDRVEVTGSMNNVYFMFSDDTCREMYDGYFSSIETMYKDLANDKKYEHAWVAKIKSNIYSDGDNFYYLYDSTDTLDMMDLYEQMQNNQNGDYSELQAVAENTEYKIAKMPVPSDDHVQSEESAKEFAMNGFTSLVDFNYHDNNGTEDDEDDDRIYARVYNPSTKEYEENDMLTKLFAQHQEDSKNYSSIAITVALSGKNIYFNLSNDVLCYNTSTGEVAVVKEYNDVYAKRDHTKEFGGMSFDVVTKSEYDSKKASEPNHYKMVNNAPIAGLAIKHDGKLYVDIATNYAYVSGRTEHDMYVEYVDEDGNTKAKDADCVNPKSYGYEFQETNYNASYSTMGDDLTYGDGMLESMGYARDHNDNEEFKWSAVFHDSFAVSKLDSPSGSYSKVSVPAFCGRDAFTEERNSDGVIKAGSRVYTEGTAHDHHYLYTKEIYYTKPNEGNGQFGGGASSSAETNENGWYVGEAYVCSECLASMTKPVKPTEGNGMFGNNDYEANLAEYEAKMAIWEELEATSGHTLITDAEATWAKDDQGKWYATYPKGTVFKDVACPDAELDILMTNKPDSNGIDHMNKKQIVASYTAEDEIKLEVVYTKSVAVDAVNNEVTYIARTAVGDDAYVKATMSETVIAVNLDTPVIESVWTNSSDMAKITWSAMEGADGFELYRTLDKDNDFSQLSTAKEDEATKWYRCRTIADGTATSYKNTGLEAGKTYYYAIRAYVVTGKDAEGKEIRTYSDFSNIEYIPGVVVLGAIYGKQFFNADNKYEDTGIRINWEAVTDADGYQIQRADSADGEFRVIKTMDEKALKNWGNAYSNRQLEPGQTYYYKIRAYVVTSKDAEGKETRSYGGFSEVYPVAAMPDAPVLTGTAHKDAGKAKLSWTQPNGAAGYQIWMSDSAKGTYKIIKSIADGNTTTYTKTDLTSGKASYFKVRTYTEVEGKKTFSPYSEVVAVEVK